MLQLTGGAQRTIARESRDEHTIRVSTTPYCIPPRPIITKSSSMELHQLVADPLWFLVHYGTSGKARDPSPLPKPLFPPLQIALTSPLPTFLLTSPPLSYSH